MNTEAIDAEIRRLEKARALLTGHTAPLKRGVAPRVSDVDERIITPSSDCKPSSTDRMISGMIAYLFSADSDRSRYDDTHVWASHVVCPGCKHKFSLYVDFRDQEQQIVNEKVRLAWQSLKHNCGEHASFLRIP
jgi:hypothetical protein